MCICWVISCLYTSYCPWEQLSSLYLPQSALAHMYFPGFPHTWRCSKPSALNWFRIVCNVALFGRNRKNSFQKPSDLSGSSSSYVFISMSIMRHGAIWNDAQHRSEPTLNRASYNSTIFCWNTSGRACWVRGDGSILHGSNWYILNSKGGKERL